MTDPIRIALIGAGIFARDAHIPAILSCGDAFRIVAIYSRSLENAQACARLVPYPVDAVNDLPALLVRDDVEAFDILLPIEAQPLIVEMALGSGRHVISEKPIAPDSETARRLVARHSGQASWMVAENYRYDATYNQAADMLRQGAIGRPLTISMARHLPLTPESKYYATAWRRDGGFPGGLLLDGGVHHIAGLRLLMGEITRVSAFSAGYRPEVKPAEAMCASLVFASGALGTYLINYSQGIGPTTDIVVHGTAGAMRLGFGEIHLTTTDGQSTIYTEKTGSVDAEMAAFARAVRHAEPHRNSPQEALQDLAVIEALLQSAASGAAVTLA
jgi:predicted dehydrogenase